MHPKLLRMYEATVPFFIKYIFHPHFQQAILSSEKETRAFLDNYRDSPNAIHYYVNQADPHGFTPLMTAVCLADSVMAMNLCKLLIDQVLFPSLSYLQGAELSTLDREGNNALMWTATVGNPGLFFFFLVISSDSSLFVGTWWFSR